MADQLEIRDESLADQRARALLEGGADLHLHTRPDVSPRSLTDAEAVAHARQLGLRAIVLKSHLLPTADRATIAAQPHIRVHGSIVCNRWVGGFNPEAVELALNLGATMVWLATMHSAHQRSRHVPDHFKPLIGLDRPPLTATDDEGNVRPEVDEILRLVAERGALLATGHLSPGEIGQLIPRAAQLGVERIVLTHPLSAVSGFTLDQTREMLAYPHVRAELTAVDTRRGMGEVRDFGYFAQVIEALGPDKLLLTSDGGQAHNPPPAAMLHEFAAGLLAAGVSADALGVMVRDNPLWLIGA